MKVRFIVFLLVLFSFLLGCSTVEPITPEERVRIENDAVARRYLKRCQENEYTVSLGNFGWSEVREYWAKVPELQAARDQFEKDGDVLRDVLMKDEEYKNAMDTYHDASPEERKEASAALRKTKHAVFDRLKEESEEYRVARKKRDFSLYESNIKTLEYIIDDYKARGEIFPVEWIQKAHHHHHNH